MGGSEEDKKKTGVPSWQLKPSDASQDGESDGQDSAQQQSPSSRASVIENARRFLLEDEVRNAPTDKQVAFLESKGLESHEIQELLGVTRNVEATSSNAEVKWSLQSNPHPRLTYIALASIRDIVEGGVIKAITKTIASAYDAGNSRCASNHNLSRISRHTRATGPAGNRQTTPWNVIPFRRPFSSPLWDESILNHAHDRGSHYFTT